MLVFLCWLFTYIAALFITLTLSWSIFYQNYIFEKASPLTIFGNPVSSMWTFRLAFYLLFIPLHLTCYMLICWLYSKVNWFGGQLWIVSLTFLVADRVSTTFWIWYFNNELPDMWVIWGMVSLLFCMTMSAVSH